MTEPLTDTVGALRKAHSLAAALGLTRADRLDLAAMLLGRDIESWNDLEPGELGRLLDHLTGWFTVEHLRREAG